MAENSGSYPPPAPPDAKPVLKAMDALKQAIADMPPPKNSDEEDEYVPDAAPIIRMCNAVIVTAIERGATEFRLEPMLRNLRIRLQVNGEWEQVVTWPKYVQFPITNRYKVMADIPYWKKGAFSGMIPIRHGRQEFNLHLTGVRSLYGDTLTFKIVNLAATNLLPPGLITETLRLLQPGKVLLISGPSDSGKTTAAFEHLKEINTIDRNIATIEHTPGIRVHGVFQTYRSANTRLSVGELAISHRRSAVDTLFIDAINDADSAGAAFDAADDGIAVLATLSAANRQAIPLLLGRWGISPSRIVSNLSGILHLRLVRTLCRSCREPYKPDSNEQNYLNRSGLVYVEELYRAPGCEECHQTGYRGRWPVAVVYRPGDHDSVVQARFDACLAEYIQAGDVSLEDASRIPL